MKCPACGFDNIEGADRCEDCLEPFRQLDVPQPREGLQASIMLDPVSKLYFPQPKHVTPDDSVAHAASIMQQERVGCVVVLQSGRLAGVLSEVDLLFDLPVGAQNLNEIKVSEVMTPNPEAVQEDTNIAHALHMMSVGEYRHLPVLRQGVVVGIVSIKDIIRYLKQRLL